VEYEWKELLCMYEAEYEDNTEGTYLCICTRFSLASCIIRIMYIEYDRSHYYYYYYYVPRRYSMYVQTIISKVPPRQRRGAKQTPPPSHGNRDTHTHTTHNPKQHTGQDEFALAWPA